MNKMDYYAGCLYEFPKRSQIGVDLKFLLNAVGDDATRMFTTVIKAETDRIYVTDGFRLHMLKQNDFMLPGQYHLISKKGKYLSLLQLQEDYRYPDIDRVIPKGDPAFTGEISSPMEREMFELIFSFPERTAFNTKYFKDMFPQRLHAYKAYWYGARKGIVFESAERKVVLMPYAIDIEQEVL